MPQATGERADLGVVFLHREDEIAPGHADAVLGAFKLRLQGEEVLVGLEVRITFGDHHQATQGAAELVLGLLVLLELFRVVEGRGIHLDRRGLGPGFDDGGQGFLLVGRIALDGFHQIGNEVGAPLILVLHLAPGGLGLFIERRDVVDAAGGQQRSQH
ncbi:hypothetical protein D9M69_655020 [compost metagenome]